MEWFILVWILLAMFMIGGRSLCVLVLNDDSRPGIVGLVITALGGVALVMHCYNMFN